jgi:hypothetical protein
MPIGAIANGVTGFQRATELASNASQRIVDATTRTEQENRVNAPEEDVVQPIVDLKRAEIAAKANAKSIEVGSKTLGALLDIRA